ncbi:MAG: hypothetical protein DRH57_04855 [Candidatus Cloacimonadota bacterium]|nr:MAG: hypothetical protein DRH57_04855 [Candidatus Cloacimonadota bacterium]
MRVATFLINMQANTTKTVYLRHGEDEVLGFISCPRSVSMKVEVYPGLWSSVRRPYGIDEFNTFLPCFAKSKKGVRVVIETEDDPAYDYAAAIFYKEAEIKSFLEKKTHLHVRPADAFGEALDIEKKVALYTHKQETKLFILGVLLDLGGFEETRYKLFKNEEEIADFVYYPFLGLPLLNFLPLQTFLRKNDTLTLEVVKAAGEAYARIHLFCSLAEISVEEIPFLNYYNPLRKIEETLEDNRLIEITEAQPIPAPPVPDKLIPYPETAKEARDIFKEKPPGVSPDISKIQKPPEFLSAINLARPDETKIVQIMPSPLGSVRPVADVRARQRITSAAITYTSGKLEVTDTSERTVVSGIVSKNVSFYAKAGSWEIKILPLYDFLSGKNISDMQTIYLDEGQSFDAEIEAVQINASCTNATETAPGILYYFVGE